MENETFACPICSVNFTTIIKFKKHLYSYKHREQYTKVYPNDVFKRNHCSRYTPWIFIKDSDYKHPWSRPILGLSQMTLCFCSEDGDGFYLCHICEQKFHERSVVSHISHLNHYNNYFAYTDPNALSFSSVLSGNTIHTSLMNNIKTEQEKTGIGELQVLHMPDRLFQECTRGNYRQVMFLLNQIRSLSDIFKERKPERMRIQTYKDDSNRKHPLLGLQHIVECMCTPHIHFRHYLCTLCSLHVSSSMIIRHLLSFDHIFTYLSVWHPSTLKAKECYRKNSSDDARTLADFAKQSEELHGPKEIQQVRLETSQMLSVLNVCFKEALSKIELIANKGSLIPTVKPGKKLEQTLSGSVKIPTNVKQESMSEPVTSGNSTLIQNIKEENEESTIEHNATPAAPSYSFHCQNCSENFETNKLYYNHLSKCKHQENFKKTFGAVLDKQTAGCKPHLHSYKYFTEEDVLCVGVSLVVTILSHRLSDEPVHLCFACETVFLRQDLKLHMNSEKHVVQSLMYQNPWNLPFAWTKRFDYLSVKLQACMEEEEKGPNKSIRILDVPPCLFPCGAPLIYSKVMEKLARYHPLLMNGVPRCETYSKLQDNDRFPILGRSFLVKYGQTISGWNFLCLLCQRLLSSDDYAGHLFSWEHVVAFLENFHPGSLDLNTTNKDMLLDLAKQAARIHPVSNAQEIEFDSSQHKSDLMDYNTKVHLLSAEKERDGKGPLMPSVTPKMKLFPRQQTQETNLDTKVTNESNAATKTQSLHGKAVEILVDGFQSADQESHVQINEPMEISLQEINNLPTEQELKEEKDPIDPSELSQLEEIKSDISSSCKSMMNTASKRQRRQSDMDTSDSETENLEPKRVCLSNPEEEKETTNLRNVDKTRPCSSSDPAVDNPAPCYGRELLSYIQRKIRNPVIGLSVIYECVCNDRAPVYLCECCHLKFTEQYITNHLSETWHYHQYLQMAGEYPLPQGPFWKKPTAKLAAYWERSEGCGETRVVNLKPEDYDKLNHSDEYFKALDTVKTYLTRTENENICLPALHENFDETVTTNRQDTSQQDMLMETDSEPVATSSRTELPSKNEITSESLDDTNLTRTPDSDAMAADIVPQCLPSTVTITSTTISSSSLLNNGKSSAKTKDGSESTNIVEDASLQMDNTTCTGAPKSEIQLKLNVNAASHVKTDDQVLKSGLLTPTTPNFGLLIPTAETSQNAPPQSPHVGLDQLVKVKCKEKRLVFCFACLVTLEATNHLTSTTHQINCVKKKFPWWSAKPGDEELSTMVAQLHDDEKASKLEPKKIEVSFDVYKELKALPGDKAIEKVRGMLKRKSLKKPGQRRPSASISEVSNSLCDISTSPNISVSPCEVTSPDLGNENGQTNPQIKSSAQPIKKELPVSAKCAPSPSPPVQKPTSKVAPRIIKGSATNDLSNLSHILSVMDTSVIGLCLVWECRVVPPIHPTFYLCESCNLTISLDKICDHMQSTEHHLKYLTRQYPLFMHWTEEELLPRMSDYLTNFIAGLVKGREVSIDAQTVLLSEECFEWVRTAPFVEALNVVQRIKEEKKTTTLPLIVTSQHEVEPREQQRTQPTMGTSNRLTDLPNQMDISITVGEITDSDHTHHEADSSGNIASVKAELCPSPMDTNSTTSPQITELLDSQSQSPASKNFPKQPDEPAYSATDQTMAVSPKDENQEHSETETKACFGITSLLSNDLAVLSSVVDTIEKTSLVTFKDTCTDTKPEVDIQLGTPSIQETSTVSPNHLEDNVTKTTEEDQMTEECSAHGHSDTSGKSTSLTASSMVDHNANETAPLDPDAEDKAALDQHYCLLLINLLKQAKSSMQHSTSFSNQTSELSPESNEEPCEAPQHARWDVEQPPKTDTDTAAKVDNIVTENRTGRSAELPRKNFTSGAFVSNKNAEKPICVNMTSVLSGNLNETTISETMTQQSQVQLVQSEDDEPVEESKVLKQLQLPKKQVQQKEIKTREIKMKNNVSGSQVSVQTSPLEIQVIQTESQYNSSVHSEVQQSQCQASQEKQELQLKSDTQEAKRPPHTSPGLMKTMQAESGAGQLQTKQTQVKILQQIQNQELQLQSQTQVVHSPNATQQGQSQKEQEQLSIAEVKLQNQQSQQQTQSQVLRLDPQTQVAPTQHATQQTQGQTGQASIDALITPRAHNTMYFRRYIDNRQNLCVLNTSVQVSQGPPLSSAATPPATSSSMAVTGGYGQFVQTANLANADYSNTHALYGVPHGSAHPSHIYHPLQTQQYYPSVEPFWQNVQHPEVSALFNPITQLQPFAQNYSVWSNETVGGTSNVAYSNAVSVNTVNNQSYTYTYNSVQENNRIIMQNLFYPPSFTPTQTNSQFFPPRQ